MPVKNPTLEELERIARSYHLNLTAQDLESFRRLMGPTLASYALLDQLTEPTLEVKYPRGASYRPQPENNPLGAWYWRCEIKGATKGLLAGKTLAIKDNVCVAGHPAMNVPCGMSNGLPVGMMLVGRNGDDATVLRAADAYQRKIGG